MENLLSVPGRAVTSADDGHGSSALSSDVDGGQPSYTEAACSRVATVITWSTKANERRTMTVR